VPEDDFGSARLEALLTDPRDTIACTTPMLSDSATPSVPPVAFEATGASVEGSGDSDVFGFPAQG
jgi:hypothetical protein